MSPTNRVPCTKSEAEQEFVRRKLKESGQSNSQIGRTINRNVGTISRFINGGDAGDETIEALYTVELCPRPTADDLAEIEKELAACEEAKQNERKIEYVPISALRPHPLNAAIYGDGCDEELLESIKKNGILQPILVSPDMQIISGHRRYNAAQMAGMEFVPVVIVETKDPLDIEEMLIVTNKQRNKTPEMIAREYAKLKEIEAERARRRQEAAGVQGEKGGRGKKKTLPVNSPEGFPCDETSEEEQAEQGEKGGRGKKKTLPQNSAEGFSCDETSEETQPDQGEARAIAADKLGISHNTAERAVKVVEKIDELKNEGKTEEAEALRTTLNQKSVNAAYKQIHPSTEKKTRRGAKSDVAALEKINAELREERNKLRAQVKKLEKENEELLKTRRKLEQENAVLKKEKADLERQLTAVTRELLYESKPMDTTAVKTVPQPTIEFFISQVTTPTAPSAKTATQPAQDERKCIDHLTYAPQVTTPTAPSAKREVIYCNYCGRDVLDCDCSGYQNAEPEDDDEPFEAASRCLQCGEWVLDTDEACIHCGSAKCNMIEQKPDEDSEMEFYQLKSALGGMSSAQPIPGGWEMTAKPGKDGRFLARYLQDGVKKMASLKIPEKMQKEITRKDDSLLLPSEMGKRLVAETAAMQGK